MIRKLHAKYINSKMGKKKASTQWVYFILLVLLLWFGLGMIFHKAPKDIREEPKLIKVSVEALSAQNTVADITVYGHTEASERVNLKVRTSGVVERIIRRKGTHASRGDTILRLRMEDREAKFRKTEIEFNTAKALLADGLISRVEYVTAEAAYEQARLDVEHTAIKAPFDGVVNDLNVEEGQYVPTGENIGSFLKLDPIKIRAEIPERYVGRERVGSVASASLSNGTSLDALLVYVAAGANTSTRTFAVELEAPNKGGKIVEGLTAEIRLPLNTIPATKITVSSCLTFGEDGTIGIKTVDDGSIVRFYPVELVREDKDGLWVSGLPARANVIIMGQEFVKVGEKVEPVFGTPDKEE
ncbi:MAG: efflux RND transporter periplasmic adaptor subunit [Rickettsiales bacterium]|jgi:multidrug efflux system membrane fusion protein|nr:efflux RND transporter periplasmic adaptor subunit [Rickettsiales bacterium]